MTDARDQADRALKDMELPADVTAEQPVEPTLPLDRTEQFRRTRFSRMRRNWVGEDAMTIHKINASIEEIIRDRFRVAYAVMDSIHKHVRTQDHDETTGELRTYADGSPVWAEHSPGIPLEDWDLLDDRTRSDLLYVIVTHMFEWQATAANIWAEAMYSKAQWREAFSGSFIQLPGAQISGKPTIEDRTNYGTRYSAEEEYFAVYCSHLSKRADALVKSMEGLRWLLEKTTIS